MNNRKILLGAFYIEGTDKYFFGLRDAKNYQMVKGGNILGPKGKLLYPDPFPTASACSNCGNRITPTGPFLGASMEELPSKCADCGGTWTPKPTEGEIEAMADAKPPKKSGGFLGLFKRS